MCVCVCVCVCEQKPLLLRQPDCVALSETLDFFKGCDEVIGQIMTTVASDSESDVEKTLRSTIDMYTPNSTLPVDTKWRHVRSVL